jgi:Periplasmic binding protein
VTGIRFSQTWCGAKTPKLPRVSVCLFVIALTACGSTPDTNQAVAPNLAPNQKIGNPILFDVETPLASPPSFPAPLSTQVGTIATAPASPAQAGAFVSIPASPPSPSNVETRTVAPVSAAPAPTRLAVPVQVPQVPETVPLLTAAPRPIQTPAPVAPTPAERSATKSPQLKTQQPNRAATLPAVKPRARPPQTSSAPSPQVITSGPLASPASVTAPVRPVPDPTPAPAVVQDPPVTLQAATSTVQIQRTPSAGGTSDSSKTVTSVADTPSFQLIETLPKPTAVQKLPRADSLCAKKVGTVVETADGSTATCQLVGKRRSWIVRSTSTPLVPEADTPCPKKQLATSRLRADRSTATCTKIGRKFQWTVTAAPVTTVSPPNTPPKTSGFDGSTIRLAVLSTKVNPLWGPSGKAITAAIESHVAAINRRGGIAGKYKLELVVKETNNDPAESAFQIRSTSDAVVGYVSVLGTNEATEEVLRERSLLASPVSQDARWSQSPNLLPISNSYQVQAINGIDFFLEQFAGNPALVTPPTGTMPTTSTTIGPYSATTTTTTIPPTTTTSPIPVPVLCSVSAMNSVGEASVEAYRLAQKQSKFSGIATTPISSEEVNLAPTVVQLRLAGCNGVLVSVSPQQTSALALAAKQIGYTPRWMILAASFSEKIVTAQTGLLLEQHAWVIGDGPLWGDSSVPGMSSLSKELLAANNRFWFENPDRALTFGFVQALVWEKLLERAVDRRDLSHAGLLLASKEIGTVDTSGLSSPIDYNQSVRLSNGQATIFTVDVSARNGLRVAVPSYASAAAVAFRR